MSRNEIDQSVDAGVLNAVGTFTWRLVVRQKKLAASMLAQNGHIYRGFQQVRFRDQRQAVADHGL